MAREFYIAPRVGTGTMEDPYRPKVSPRASGSGWAGVCNDTQCLVLVTGDTTAEKADGQLVTLVADNLDVTVASLPNNVRNRIQNGLTNKGIPLTLTDYTLVRDFLTALGEYFSPGFNLANFFVSGS